MEKKNLYLSNLEKNVYVIHNLPEEVIATLFAYVSRNSESLREDILKVTEEKAKNFHEKWVINYGHSSIAEMAVIHIGVEKVSRLFSSILERSNLHISFIEYSQRYQKVQKEDFFIPKILDQYPELKKLYSHTQCELYDLYLKVIEKMGSFYHQNFLKENNTEPTPSDFLKFGRKSFEDARYLLSLSFFTNLSMTSNARALEESLMHLLSSPYPEVVDTALEIKKESLAIFPTLIKYAQDNSFLSYLEKNVLENQELLEKENNDSYLLHNLSDDLYVKYISSFENHSISPEKILNQILAKYFYEFSSKNLKELEVAIQKKSFEEKINIFKRIFKKYSKYDPIPKFLSSYTYTFEIFISEACWHQFLRHRKIKLTYQSPTMRNGYILPAHLEKIEGIQELFHIAYNKANSLFQELEKINFYLSHYAVLNMCRRKIICEVTLADLYHLIQLRLSPNSQEEIQNLIWKFVYILYPNYWFFLEPALISLKENYPNDSKILKNLEILFKSKTE